jgi:hypothetical protein
MTITIACAQFTWMTIMFALRLQQIVNSNKAHFFHNTYQAPTCKTLHKAHDDLAVSLSNSHC